MPANLYKFNDEFSNYFYVGTSAMSRCVEQGIKKSLRNITLTIHCDERYVIVKIADLVLLVNVCLLCVGSKGT